MDDPLNPDEYGEVFAEALQSLCDDGTEIDCSFGTDDAELLLTISGMEYRVTIVAEPSDDLSGSSGDE